MSWTRLSAIGAALALTLGGLIALPAAASAAPAASPTTSPTTPADSAVLSATPYAGWNTYFGIGTDFTTADLLDVAHFLKSSGLAKAGYDIVWLDGGWQSSVPRGADGKLAVDTSRFPGGMKALTDQLHAMGLKAGIYTDAGPYTAATASHCGLGSYGHYQTDADTFAAWGFDAVKVDFLCGIAANLDPKTVFTQFAQALQNNSSHREMILNICNPVTSPAWGDYPETQQSTYTWTYAPKIAQSWRTYTDVGFIGNIAYTDVLRNFDANAAHPEVAGPGHWSDPDFLGPQLGMTDTEFRSQMALWAISAAPLIIGSDPRTLSATSLATLTNPDVLAIDRDPLGKQGVRVGPAGQNETWVKPLADGSVAVALVNRSDSQATITTTPTAIGIDADRVSVRDAWTHQTTEAKGTVGAVVPAHGVELLIVHQATAKPGTPHVLVTAPSAVAVDGTAIAASDNVLVADGSHLTVAVKVTNEGTTPLKSLTTTLAVPSGWFASPTRVVARKPVSPGASTTAQFTVTVPADAGTGSYTLSSESSYAGPGGAGQATSPSATVVVAPAPPTGTVPLSHQSWVSATSGWMDPTIDQSVGGGNPIRVARTTYATGIGVSSTSDIRYYLGGQCTRLTGLAGIDDVVAGASEGGTVTFSLAGDGRTLWQTDTVTGGTAATYDVNLTGVRELVLHVGDAGDGTYNDRADWAAPTITCN